MKILPGPPRCVGVEGADGGVVYLSAAHVATIHCVEGGYCSVFIGGDELLFEVSADELAEALFGERKEPSHVGEEPFAAYVEACQR